MERKDLFGVLSIISFALIGFTQSDSGMWIAFAVIGIVFGVGWFVSK